MQWNHLCHYGCLFSPYHGIIKSACLVFFYLSAKFLLLHLYTSHFLINKEVSFLFFYYVCPWMMMMMHFSVRWDGVFRGMALKGKGSCSLIVLVSNNNKVRKCMLREKSRWAHVWLCLFQILFQCLGRLWVTCPYPALQELVCGFPRKRDGIDYLQFQRVYKETSLDAWGEECQVQTAEYRTTAHQLLAWLVLLNWKNKKGWNWSILMCKTMSIVYIRLLKR